MEQFQQLTHMKLARGIAFEREERFVAPLAGLGIIIIFAASLAGAKCDPVGLAHLRLSEAMLIYSASTLGVGVLSMIYTCVAGRRLGKSMRMVHPNTQLDPIIVYIDNVASLSNIVDRIGRIIHAVGISVVAISVDGDCLDRGAWLHVLACVMAGLLAVINIISALRRYIIWPDLGIPMQYEKFVLAKELCNL